MLATMPLFFALSQALLIDVLLTACMTATLLGVHAAHTAEQKRIWAILVAVGAALGILAKGLVALVLPGGIALLFLLWRRDFATIRALLHWQALLAFAVVVLPWFVLVSRRNPEFLEFFFVREHFQRFTASGPIRVGHPEGPFYYIPVLMFGPAPWTLLVPLLAATAAGRRAFTAIPAESRVFCLLWLGIVVGFFSAATSKLGSYIVPALPALALILGAWLDRALDDEALSRPAIRLLRGTFAVLGVVFALAALLAWPLHARIAQWLHVDVPDVIVIAGAVSSVALALLAATFASRWLRYEERGRPGAAMAVLVGAQAVMLLLAIEGRAVTKTGYALAAAMAPLREPGDLLVSYMRLMQSLGFYTRQRIVQFNAYHEIAEGAQSAPDHDDWFWNDFSRLEREWASGRRVFIATDKKHIPHLTEELDPKPRLLVQDHRRVVLVNFPATGPGSVEAHSTSPEHAAPPGG
jgi:4-amino-4-deoxy-L-arabinose transferase-like glycosyltransferase